MAPSRPEPGPYRRAEEQCRVAEERLVRFGEFMAALGPDPACHAEPGGRPPVRIWRELARRVSRLRTRLGLSPWPHRPGGH